MPRFKVVSAFGAIPFMPVALATSAFAANIWYVDGVNGDDKNNCKSPQTACKTIGHAISLASSGDSIMVAAATYTENLIIGKSLKIGGADVSTTIIDGGGVESVISISTGREDVALSRLTLKNGKSTGSGGGIYLSSGRLRINACAVVSNTARTAGGGIYIGGGRVTINNSSVSNNLATDGGGGIYNHGGMLTINRSTLNGNHSRVVMQHGSPGGGMFNNSGTVVVNNSTLSGNAALLGGGISTSGTLASTTAL
jgi:hypothetical protein